MNENHDDKGRFSGHQGSASGPSVFPLAFNAQGVQIAAPVSHERVIAAKVAAAKAKAKNSTPLRAMKQKVVVEHARSVSRQNQISAKMSLYGRKN